MERLDRSESLIQPVADRPGHDRRYCVDTAQLRALGWEPQIDFESGIVATVDWYVRNEKWWRPVKEENAEYHAYYERQYKRRRA